jgi:hypothetical protein
LEAERLFETLVTTYQIIRCCNPKAHCMNLHCLFIFNGSKAPWGPKPPHYRDFTITLRHITLGRTPLDEWSARRTDLYLTKHNTHKRDIHVTGGIRTHDPSKRAAADPRLRPRGHWERPSLSYKHKIEFYTRLVRGTTGSGIRRLKSPRKRRVLWFAFLLRHSHSVLRSPFHSSPLYTICHFPT